MTDEDKRLIESQDSRDVPDIDPRKEESDG